MLGWPVAGAGVARRSSTVSLGSTCAATDLTRASCSAISSRGTCGGRWRKWSEGNVREKRQRKTSEGNVRGKRQRDSAAYLRLLLRLLLRRVLLLRLPRRLLLELGAVRQVV